jgi:hypothetical protein
MGVVRPLCDVLRVQRADIRGATAGSFHLPGWRSSRRLTSAAPGRCTGASEQRPSLDDTTEAWLGMLDTAGTHIGPESTVRRHPEPRNLHRR